MEFLSAEIIFSFFTLSLLEIILGIDNLIFIALVVQHLPPHKRASARMIGLGLALLMRIVMLLGLTWVMALTQPVVTLFDIGFSYKDMLLIAGGIFLVAKATLEMHRDVAGVHEHKEIKVASSFFSAVSQIILIDVIFSFDSIITAVGITDHTGVIIAAIVVSMVVMTVASGWISSFLAKHPTFKMLALSFILMIGTMLLADGLHFHVPRGYVYFSFAFAIFVEALNTLARRKRRKSSAIKDPGAN